MSFASNLSFFLFELCPSVDLTRYLYFIPHAHHQKLSLLSLFTPPLHPLHTADLRIDKNNPNPRLSQIDRNSRPSRRLPKISTLSLHPPIKANYQFSLLHRINLALPLQQDGLVLALENLSYWRFFLAGRQPLACWSVRKSAI